MPSLQFHKETNAEAVKRTGEDQEVAEIKVETTEGSIETIDLCAIYSLR